MSDTKTLVVANRDDLVAIANAIRTKTGKTDGLTLGQMPKEISRIQGGGSGDGYPRVVENIINIDVGTSVTCGKYYTHFLYNDVRLPRIPADKFKDCPYVMILQINTGEIYVYGSTSKPYYQVKSSVERLELPSGRTRTLYDVENDVWGEANTSTDSTYCALSTKWTVIWSNHDIPNGSATATDIYFAGSEPVPTD